MLKSSKFVRRLLIAGLAVSLVATSGCTWFRSKVGYEDARETRPLEVPPGLRRPATDPSMQLPPVGTSASAVASAQTPPPATAAAGSTIVVDDHADSAWRRVGLALEAMDGVTINNRAQLVRSYEIEFQGEPMLIRVQSRDDASVISAMNPMGQPLTDGSAAEVLNTLAQRLN